MMRALMQAPTDEQLLARTAQADEQAFEELMARHWPAAYQAAYRLLGEPGTAEDAAQEAFIRLHRSAGSYDPGQPFRPWFLRIVRNAARNYYRARRRREGHEERARRPTPGPESPEEQAVRREQAGLVRTHLAALRDDLQEALTFRFLSGVTFRELADILDCPEGTAASRVRRGLEALERSLKPALALSPAAIALLLAEPAEATAPPPPPTTRVLAAAGRRSARSLPLGVLALVGVVAAVAVAWLGGPATENTAGGGGNDAGRVSKALGPFGPGFGARDRPEGEGDDGQSARTDEAGEGGTAEEGDAAGPTGVASDRLASGRLLLEDVDGWPLSTVQVDLTLNPDGEPRRMTTDAAGGIALSELPPGTYVVQLAVREAHPTQRYTYPDEHGEEQEVVQEPEVRTELEVEVTWAAGANPDTVVRIPREPGLYVRVLDAGGDPVSAQVHPARPSEDPAHIFAPKVPAAFGAYGGPWSPRSSDDHGVARYGEVHAPVRFHCLHEYWIGQTEAVQGLAEGEIRMIVLDLERPFHRGGLAVELIDARSQKSVGLGFSAGRVRFVRPGGESMESQFRQFDHLDPGLGEVRIRAEGYCLAARPVTIVAGELTELQVVLEPEVRLTGRVLDAEGNPRPLARVTLAPDDPHAALFNELMEKPEMPGYQRGGGIVLSDSRVDEYQDPRVVDLDGTFSLPGLDPQRTYTLVVEPLGRASQQFPGLRPGGGPYDLRLEATDALVLELSTPNGEPLTAQLTIEAGDVRAVGYSDGSGRTEVEGVPYGEVRIVAYGEASYIDKEAFHQPGVPLRLQARPYRQVSGQLFGPDGPPAAGASVWIEGKQAGLLLLIEMPFVEADEQGRFTIRTPRARLPVRITHARWPTHYLTLEAPEGGGPEVAITLPRPVQLTGRVAGIPLESGDSVVVRAPESGRKVADAQLSSDGGFDLGRVPAGTWLLELERHGVVLHAEELELDSSSPAVEWIMEVE